MLYCLLPVQTCDRVVRWGRWLITSGANGCWPASTIHGAPQVARIRGRGGAGGAGRRGNKASSLACAVLRWMYKTWIINATATASDWGPNSTIHVQADSPFAQRRPLATNYWPRGASKLGGEGMLACDERKFPTCSLPCPLPFLPPSLLKHCRPTLSRDPFSSCSLPALLCSALLLTTPPLLTLQLAGSLRVDCRSLPATM